MGDHFSNTEEDVTVLMEQKCVVWRRPFDKSGDNRPLGYWSFVLWQFFIFVTLHTDEARLAIRPFGS